MNDRSTQDSAAATFDDRRGTRSTSRRVAVLLIIFGIVLGALLLSYSVMVIGLASVIRAADSHVIYTPAHSGAIRSATRYAESGDPEELRAFQRHISAIRHHRKAANHLRAEKPDLSAATRELVAGSVTPAAARAVVRLFSRHRRDHNVITALTVWKSVDDEALSLTSVVDGLGTGEISPARRHQAAHAIAGTAARIVNLTARFSDLSATAAHDIAETLARLLLIAALVALLAVAGVTLVIWDRVRESERIARLRIDLMTITQQARGIDDVSLRAAQLFCDTWRCSAVIWHRETSDDPLRIRSTTRGRSSPIDASSASAAAAAQLGALAEAFRGWTPKLTRLTLSGAPSAAVLRTTGAEMVMTAPVVFRGGVLAVVQFLCNGPAALQMWRNFADRARTWEALAPLFGSAVARLAVEEALMASEGFHRAITETINDAIMTVDTDLNITFSNSAARQIFGYEGTGLTNRNLSDLMAMPLAGMRSLTGRGLSTESFGENGSEWTARRADGSEILLHVSSGRFRHGGKTQFVVIARDITERRRQEEERRARDQQLRVLLSQLPLALWSTDRKLQIQSVAGTAFYPMLDGPLTGRPVHEIFFPQQDAGAGRITAAHEAVMAGEQLAFELHWQTAVLQCYLEPVRDSRGEVDSVVGVAFDITDRKQTEIALRHSEERLRVLSAGLLRVQEEERRRISREIHDQLGQVLSALKLEIGWLRNMPDDERTEDRWRRAIVLVDDTIQTVRSIARSLRPQVLDDFGLATALRRELGEFAERSGIRCTTVIEPEDLSVPDETATTIFRIFQEAMTNVVRHAEASDVTLSLERLANEIVFEISDNGKGIPREALNRLDKSVGIAGMTERAALLGGSARIASEPGRGTTVRVSIPVQQDSAKETT